MTSFSEIEDLLTAATRRTERRVGEAKALASQGQRAQQEAQTAALTVQACEEATAFLNSFADARQQVVQEKVEQLVTHGLRTIFEDETLSFHMISEQRASRTEVTFHLRSMMGDQVVETPILDARGGGVAAVIGFLLRLVLLLLRGSERPLLVLDEVWAQLSAEYEPRMGQFAKELSERTGVQIILVTHSPIYASYADKVYRVALKDGVSLVEADV